MNALLPSALLPLSDVEFNRYQRLVLHETGIHLHHSKRTLVASRLARRLRETGLVSYGRYFERVRANEDERVRMIDLLLTNETAFFREPAHFSFISTSLIPLWLSEAASGRRRPSLRVWSAGCATGEEPYSVAMLLYDGLPGWALDVVATDLSTSALRIAEQGVWPMAKAASIPEELLRRYMLRGVGDRAGVVKIRPEIRSIVQFRRVNLVDAAQHPAGPFDIILCRNVLIYFEPEARRTALSRLIAACRPGGHLFIGHAETLQGFSGMKSEQPTIWRRTP